VRGMAEEKWKFFEKTLAFEKEYAIIPNVPYI
jgi:hypothetical protein